LLLAVEVGQELTTKRRVFMAALVAVAVVVLAVVLTVGTELPESEIMVALALSPLPPAVVVGQVP
jgi:hypothetical protein